MRMYPSRILHHALTLIVLLTFSSGCVKRMSAAQGPQGGASGLATLRSVSVSADASRIDLTSDKPFTYTSYKAGEPAKVVIDISQALPGSVATPIEVNRGNIKRIDLVRQPVGKGWLTRVEVSLVRDADFLVATEASDNTHLLISLVAPVADAKQSHQDSKEAPLAEAKVEEKVLTLESAASASVAPASGAGGEVQAADQPADQKTAQSKIEPSVTPVLAAAPGSSANSEAVAEPATVKPEATPEARPEAKPEAGRRLTGIAPVSDGIELTIDGGLVTFNSFKLTKPDRIVVDLFGMKNGVGQKVVPIGSLGIANARIGSTPDKVRVVLDALGSALPPYEVAKSDSGLKIRLKDLGRGVAATGAGSVAAAAVPESVSAAPAASSVAAQPAAAPAAETAPVRPAAAPQVTAAVEVPAARSVKGALESLDFKIVDGFSRITIRLQGSCEPGKPVHGVQGLSLSIGNCQVPKRLQRALNTTQFGSPVLSITPYQTKVKGANVAKLLVRLKGNPLQTLRREGDLLVWDITNPGPLPVAQLPTSAPVRAKELAEPKAVEDLVAPLPRTDEAMFELPTVQRTAKKAYKGRRVTLEFSDADVRKIFQLIAEVSNLNFLVADDVTGTISLKLVNVPWDQALDVILDAKGLGMQRDGNIVQIKPKSKIQSQADEDLLAKKATERAMELKTAVFEVNYASTGDVALQFAAIKSERGTITKDDRTSRVIVKDIQTALDEMRVLLKTLDSPEKQVMIEARIVEATSDFTRDLGVQWSLNYRDGSASLLGINSASTTFGGVVSTAGPGASGTGGIGMGMSFGKLTSNIQLDMRLAAVATIDQVKVISTPKIVTLNNKGAKISQGQSIPYQTVSAEGTKTEFVEAALTLEVTPHITADGAVSMKIKASNNSPGTGTPPPINKKEATTELLVANGETTVIGGIYVDNDTETDTGVPFLADIPMLGWLFKSNTKRKNKTELLIFITPKLLN